MGSDETIAVAHQHQDSSSDFSQGRSPNSSQTYKLFGRKAGLTKLIVSITLLGAAGAVLTYNYGLSEIQSDVRQLSLLAICSIFTMLLANALAATFRFKAIATEIGHPISFRHALATVSVSNLAGAMFFQIAGQLIARGVIAGRGGIPFPAIVVITTYERIPTAILSAIFALAGAIFIFGNVYLDRSAGGAELIKIVVGLGAAVIVGALFGYGRMLVREVTPLLTRSFLRQCLTIIGLALLVHIPMQAAYVLSAHALSPQTPIPELIAASAIVMFATSVPISFAGWGLREMSAVVGLGAIGVPAHAALTAAVIIGIGSLLVVGIFATISLPNSVSRSRATPTQSMKPVDYHRILAWVLPVGTAMLVLFQIYIPIGAGLLNVNLADPIALIGGSLLVLNAIRNGKAPGWRASGVNTAVAIATLVLAASLMIGCQRFGCTTWAWVNRFLGWFVLLAYGATGALGVAEHGKVALRIILLTFVGAVTAIAGIEVILVVVRQAGIHFPAEVIPPNQILGFSQNHNFFAFQLLMAISAALVFLQRARTRLFLLTLFFSAFWFAASKSGWIGAVSVTTAALYFRVANMREVLCSVICAACVAAIVHLGAGVSNIDAALPIPLIHDAAATTPLINSAGDSTSERMITITGGFKLFIEHPLFGAGLGAFRNQMILATSGVPLVIHSTILWLLAELGIVGFLAFTFPALVAFVTEWRHAKSDRVSAFMVLCFVAFGIMSAPADMLYQRTFWFVLGAALAVTTRAARLQLAGKPLHASAAISCP